MSQVRVNISLSILVVNWNTCDLLAQCLDSIYAHPPACNFEIIVVDNASTDDSTAMVRERFPQVSLIHNEVNMRFARANNQAIGQHRGKYMLLLNSDAEVTRGALDSMLVFLESHPHAGVLGPTLLNHDGSFQASYARFPTVWSEISQLTGITRWTIGPYAPSPRPNLQEAPEPVDWVAGAAMMVRSDAIDEVGLLDESYVFYSEETDLCWRMHQAGWQVWYIPTANVIHIGGASTQKHSVESYIRLYEAKVRFIHKAYGSGASVRLHFAIKMITALRLIARILTLPFTILLSNTSSSTKIRKEIALLRHTFLYQ